MSKEASTPPPMKAQPLNEDVMKGVLVDGIGIHIGKDFAILEGIISKPRSEVTVVVARMILPIDALEKLGTGISEVLKKRKEMLKQAKKKSEK